MKRAICFIPVLILLTAGCNKRIESEKHITYNDFKHSLTSQMNYVAIVKEFGLPQKDIGSGIHIYVYGLSDSTEVWIGYTDRILYANHVDKNHNLSDVIIGKSADTLTYDYFVHNLNSRMNYAEIVRVFGQPQRDNGSGIHIYVYELNDSTEIWIGYADKIFYAKHVDKNQQLIDTLI